MNNAANNITDGVALLWLLPFLPPSTWAPPHKRERDAYVRTLATLIDNVRTILTADNQGEGEGEVK